MSARVDYAMRALLELTAVAESGTDRLVTRDELAEPQGIPSSFLESILRQLRQAGLISSRRGVDGGYRLAKPADSVTVGDVVRALDGPLSAVRGDRPQNATYVGPAEHLQDVWIATRAAIRNVLDEVTLADIAHNDLPAEVTSLTASPGAWESR